MTPRRSETPQPNDTKFETGSARQTPVQNFVPIRPLGASRQMGEIITKIFLVYIHRVPKKTKQICFCQNCVKFPPISITFGRKMANDPNICEVHSFSTSSNLHHHLTVLNANVPNCYITPNVVICNKLLKT